MKLTLYGISLVLLIGITLILLSVIALLVSVGLKAAIGKKARNQIAGAFTLGIFFIAISLITGQ